jgi:peptide/nickel transport system permease protein
VTILGRADYGRGGESQEDNLDSASSGRHGTYGRYVLGRCLGSLGSLAFMLLLSFFLFRVLPGDPARTLGRGRFTTPEQLEEFKRTYGLDQPLPQQFLTFLKNTLSGDLGISLRYRVPVSDLIGDRM